MLRNKWVCKNRGDSFLNYNKNEHSGENKESRMKINGTIV